MGGLGPYLVKRLIQAVITLFVITSVTWALFEGMPGDPTDQLYGNPNLKATQIAQMAVQMGLANEYEDVVEPSQYHKIDTFTIGNTTKTFYQAGKRFEYYQTPRVIIPIWSTTTEAGQNMQVFIKVSDDGKHWDHTVYKYYLVSDNKLSSAPSTRIEEELNETNNIVYWLTADNLEDMIEIENGKFEISIYANGSGSLTFSIYYGSNKLGTSTIQVNADEEKLYFANITTSQKYIPPGDKLNLTVKLNSGNIKIAYGLEETKITFKSLLSPSLKNSDRIQYVGTIPRKYAEFYVLMSGNYNPVKLRIVYVIDKPLIERYGNYIKNMFTFNFGYSTNYNKPVSEVLAAAIPRTLLWFGIATILQYMIGIALGSYIAWRRGSPVEGVVIVSSLFFYNMPSFWIGLIFIWIFSFYLGWFPLGGFSSGDQTGPGSTCAKLGICPGNPIYPVVDIAWHLTLPMIVILVLGMAGVTLLMRTTMLETIGEDYVLTAKAKGLPEKVVKNRHARRNAMLPIVTSFVISFSFSIGGAVILEQIFSYQGVGQTYIKALLTQDQFLAGASLFIISVMVVLGNLIADILYGYLDPRVRVG